MQQGLEAWLLWYSEGTSTGLALGGREARKKSCLQNQSLVYFPNEIRDIAIRPLNNPGYPERQRPTAEDMISTFDKIYSAFKNHHSIVKGFLIMDILFYT